MENSDVSFAYPGGEKIYEDFSLSATPGDNYWCHRRSARGTSYWERLSSVNTLTKEGSVSTAKNYPG